MQIRNQGQLYNFFNFISGRSFVAEPRAFKQAIPNFTYVHIYIIGTTSTQNRSASNLELFILNLKKYISLNFMKI